MLKMLPDPDSVNVEQGSMERSTNNKAAMIASEMEESSASGTDVETSEVSDEEMQRFMRYLTNENRVLNALEKANQTLTRSLEMFEQNIFRFLGTFKSENAEADGQTGSATASSSPRDDPTSSQRVLTTQTQRSSESRKNPNRKSMQTFSPHINYYYLLDTIILFVILICVLSFAVAFIYLTLQNTQKHNFNQDHMKRLQLQPEEEKRWETDMEIGNGGYGTVEQIQSSFEKLKDRINELEKEKQEASKLIHSLKRSLELNKADCEKLRERNEKLEEVNAHLKEKNEQFKTCSILIELASGKIYDRIFSRSLFGFAFGK